MLCAALRLRFAQVQALKVGSHPKRGTDSIQAQGKTITTAPSPVKVKPGLNFPRAPIHAPVSFAAERVRLGERQGGHQHILVLLPEPQAAR